MPNVHIILSILAEDRPGIVSSVADVVKRHSGNWLESSLSTLRGSFAGMVHVDLPSIKLDDLTRDLAALSIEGISIHINQHSTQTKAASEEPTDPIVINLEANDREGIVEEIAKRLSSLGANVLRFETHRESAAMAGYELFFATLEIKLPNALTLESLEKSLESLSDDLMLTVN